MAPKNYLLIKSSGPDRNGRNLTALASAKLLLDAKTWPLWTKTRNRKVIAAGDRLAVYLAGSSEVIATAVVSRVEKWNAIHANRYPLMLDSAAHATLILGDIHLLTTPVTVKERLKQLSFINQESEKWGVAFMGGTRAVSDDDFRVLTTV